MKSIKELIVKFNLINILSIPFYLCRIFKIDNNKIVCFNFSGKGYGDNPKYVVEELLKDNRYKIIWMVNNISEEFPERVTQVKIYSLRYFYEMSTAKVWINNSRLPLFVRKRKKQFYINTWHGGLGLKKIEKQAEDKLSAYYKKAAPHDSSMIDLVISNSKYRTDIYRNDFWYQGRVLECGCPRNDIYFKRDIHEEIVKSVKEFLKIDENKKIILYAPTFRNGNEFNYFSIDYTKLVKEMKKCYNDDYVFVVRLHSRVEKKNISFDENIIDATSYPDADELLIASDILISDYSSIFFDFLYLNKPVFLYAPDYENYLDERGLNFIYNELPFSISYSSDELLKNIVEKDYNNYEDKLDRFLDEMRISDDGNASSSIVKVINNVVEGKYNMKKYKIGYTQGTYDLFHIGHLNLINNAKKQCDYLIVGVNSDKLVKEYKNKQTNINEDDRAKIVSCIKGVDEVFITDTLDKTEILNKIKYDAIFIGDDWKGNERWAKTEKSLAKYGIDVVYLPHTDGVSTSDIVSKIK